MAKKFSAFAQWDLGVGGTITVRTSEFLVEGTDWANTGGTNSWSVV